MKIDFDPAKDAVNRAKHGVSLAAAKDMDIRIVIEDRSAAYGEPRFRAFGMIGGLAYCLAFTLRDASVRVISLRRAHAKEYKRYAS